MSVGGLEAVPSHGHVLVWRGELELLVGGVDLGHQLGVLLVQAKVVLDDVEGLLVDLHVLVGLEELNLVQACKTQGNIITLMLQKGVI